MSELAGRGYLVTGGGSGIGAAAARRLRERGADVLVCGRREQPLRELAAEIGCSWLVADCADEDAVGRLVDTTVARLGGLHGLVSAAGTMFSGTVLDTSPAQWEASLRGNATSAFLVARAALPRLVETRGSLVFVSSIAALRSSGGSVAYAVAKAAVVSLGQAIAAEFGPAGIRSNVVCPGWVRTPMADEEMTVIDEDPDAAYRAITALVPQRRAAEPDEVAEAISWLSGPQSSYVNGAVLVVDGGTTIVDAGTVGFDFTVRSR